MTAVDGDLAAVLVALIREHDADGDGWCRACRVDGELWVYPCQARLHLEAALDLVRGRHATPNAQPASGGGEKHGNGHGAVWLRPSGAVRGSSPEVALLAGAAAMRDASDPEGALLLFPRAAWLVFVAAVRAGEFD